VTTPILRDLDAITVPVPSLDAGLAFYQRVLGQDLIWRTERQAGLRLPAAGTELVLTIDQQLEANWLVESVDEAVARFSEHGGSVLHQPFDIPVGRIAVVADPFGNTLVLISLTGHYTTDPEGRVTGVSAT
jgi:predicted enzyme related to lactoylglutathione lyase